MPQPKIQIIGLREVRRALRQVDEALPRELSRAMKDQVATPVAGLVRARVATFSNRWAKVVRPGGNARGAYITWGRASAEWHGWAEFGGKRPRDRRRVRPYRASGRFVYPTVARAAPMARRAAERVVTELARKADLD